MCDYLTLLTDRIRYVVVLVLQEKHADAGIKLFHKYMKINYGFKKS